MGTVGNGAANNTQDLFAERFEYRRAAVGGTIGNGDEADTKAPGELFFSGAIEFNG